MLLKFKLKHNLLTVCDGILVFYYMKFNNITLKFTLIYESTNNLVLFASYLTFSLFYFSGSQPGGKLPPRGNM